MTISSFQEPLPGPAWARHCLQHLPRYRGWYQRHRQHVPDRATCESGLKGHMPELWPIYQQLLGLSGGGDLEARFLCLFNPPAYLAGCSQAAHTWESPALIRNYDYSPKLFEGVLAHTHWRRPVIAMLDCLWGALDGINDAGLAVSLAFGGGKTLGRGFGIPLILRYILETRDTTAEAIEVLHRIPSHMAYNVTLIDRSGQAATVFLHPRAAPQMSATALATNHQQRVEWESYARLTATRERALYLSKRLADPLENLKSMTRHFLEPPLYRRGFDSGFGTLYTAVYRPQSREAHYLWPQLSLKQSFAHFRQGSFSVGLDN